MCEYIRCIVNKCCYKDIFVTESIIKIFEYNLKRIWTKSGKLEIDELIIILDIISAKLYSLCKINCKTYIKWIH